MTDLAVVAQSLVKTFGDVHALDGVDLEVPTGTITALLGPNGAGKTTTVRILTTLLQPTSGSAYVAGFDVVKHPDTVRGVIGLSGQYSAVDEKLTGRENLDMVGMLFHLPRDIVRRRSLDLLERFDLADAANRPAKTYSGGMRRRLDLAASLVANPHVLFLDEPTTGLDPRSRMMMWGVITELVQSGTTVLLTTQYLEEADQLANTIAVIDHGKVIARGTASELKAQVGGERVEIVTEHADDLARAVETISSLGDGSATVLGQRISLPVSNGGRTLIEVLRAIDSAGIAVSDVQLRRPTLDDVFLTLTGHAAEDETPQDDSATPAKGRGRGRKKSA
jgi:ABC-2 type transport system ATP-binding protein